MFSASEEEVLTQGLVPEQGGGLIFDIENDVWTSRTPLNWVQLGHYSWNQKMG